MNKNFRYINIMENNEPLEYDSVDLYLFFDLMAVSRKIYNCTSKNDIIILVGDTGSYLRPFLEVLGRKVFNLPISGKPYACTFPPHSSTIKYNEYLYYIPQKEEEEFYFNYLDSETFLTKKFVSNNWKNLVLVDTSSGQSIHGMSVFLNRYIKNINPNHKCDNFMGIEPLKFIRLTSINSESVNINPAISKKYIDKISTYRNFNPKLIIVIGSAIFYFGYKFYIEEKYPRYVPEYTIRKWNKDPYQTYTYGYSKQSYTKAIKNLKLLKKLFQLYIEFVNSKNIKYSNEILHIIKLMPVKSNDEENIKEIMNKKSNSTSKIYDLFSYYKNKLTILKYSNYDIINDIITR